MSNSAILVRTNTDNAAVCEFIARLQRRTGLLVYVVADEREKPLSKISPEIKISMTGNAIRELDLLDTPDVGWRCGDYCYYLAAKNLNKFDFFWLIEPDVYMNDVTIGDFFRETEERKEDFLAFYMRPASDSWAWKPRMARFIQNVNNCFFPLTRLSKHAISSLLPERIAMSRRFIDEGLDDFPNDESFVATAIPHLDLTSLDLASVFPQVTRDKFGLGVFYQQRLELCAENGQIYHSCLSGVAFLRKVRWLIKYKPQDLSNGLLIEELEGVVDFEGDESLRQSFKEELLLAKEIASRNRDA